MKRQIGTQWNATPLQIIHHFAATELFGGGSPSPGGRVLSGLLALPGCLESLAMIRPFGQSLPSGPCNGIAKLISNVANGAGRGWHSALDLAHLGWADLQ